MSVALLVYECLVASLVLAGGLVPVAGHPLYSRSRQRVAPWIDVLRRRVPTRLGGVDLAPWIGLAILELLRVTMVGWSLV